MKTHVEFRSNAFPPYEGEENEINPGRYGKRVAEFLVHGLREKGFELLNPIAEDWGWVVPIKNDGFRLWIGCGNYDEFPDGSCASSNLMSRLSAGFRSCGRLIRPRRSMLCRKRSTNCCRRIRKSELSDGGVTRNSTGRHRQPAAQVDSARPHSRFRKINLVADRPRSSRAGTVLGRDGQSIVGADGMGRADSDGKWQG